MFLLRLKLHQGDTFQVTVHDYLFCMVSALNLSFSGKENLVQDIEWPDMKWPDMKSFHVLMAPSWLEPTYI
jgi:hypothetical protein